MSEYVSLTGEVVFNHINKPDVFMGASNYKITIALDKEGLETAEKEGLSLIDYKGAKQILLNVRWILVSLRFIMQIRKR